MDNIIQNTIEMHKNSLKYFEESEINKLNQIADLISDAIKGGGNVYIAGNGGSASDAQHIAAELVGRFKFNRNPLPAISLTTDSSVLTCISNDFDFESIFSRQINAFVNSSDIVWLLSTSGSSKNILSAAKAAKEKGAKIIAFNGCPGSELEKLSNICLNIDTNNTSTIQEIHQLAYHIVCELIEIKIFKDTDK